MKVEIEVKDEISPMLLYWVENNERYFRALTKSVGWWYQKSIKEDIKEGHAGNVEYVERWDLSLRRKLDPNAPKAWYGKLRNAVGYEYKGNGVVSIGWTSPTSSKYGDMQEQGYSKVVTDRMRKYFRMRGINLSNNTQELNIPDRPIYEPMADVLFKQVAPYINNKITEYMTVGIEKGKKKRREYKVY